ncbi:hypothetical protein [Candidatus Ruthturnera calyptogenae]|uniref:hypothetical protein n=1 Tax=Candidatus Ruthturnera calyptogenae TaxID=386487 RepID=UPI0004B1C717
MLRLPLKTADSWCKTSATDAKSFYYNPSFIDQQIKFVLIHEAMQLCINANGIWLVILPLIHFW